MVNIAIAGAAGRMGRRLCALAHEHPELKLVGGFERPGHEDIGKDIGLLAGFGNAGIALTPGIESVLGHAQVIIDFTAPEASTAHAEACAKAGKAMVIGTTGMKGPDIEQVAKAAQKTPIVMASNMSLGVNLLLKVLADVAKALGDDYDVEIVEAHHKLKKDAPSGTALMMANAVADALNRDKENDYVYCRKGMVGERTKREIGIQTIRAGDIVGEHTVYFGGMGERIEITHRASSRDTFARGALRAALWLGNKKPALYNMQDVLGLR